MNDAKTNSRTIVKEAALLILKSSLAFLLLLWLLTGCQKNGQGWTWTPNDQSVPEESVPSVEPPTPEADDEYTYARPVTPETEPVADEEEVKVDLEMDLTIEIAEDTEIEEMVFEEAPDVGFKERITEDFNTEEYNRIYENEFQRVGERPLSTFSIDVDNASYSNVRRYLTQYHQLPPPDAVRIEEMINYFSYDYPQPTGEHPFTLTTEVAACPWNTDHQLLHVGLQGKAPDYDDLRPSNLVFLLDVSGSMEEPNKLPLVKKSFRMLVNALDARDRVAIVVYAGAAGLVLPATAASEQQTIEAALDRLAAGGSTAGGEGIELAYRIAEQHFVPEGNNRVILATDGDFNIGTSATGDLVRLIEEKRQKGVYLTICGFGMGNYKDGRMEQISNAGNGNYFYIDTIQEAEKVFVREMRANLFTIAKDVKLQLEFNPTRVKEYRLIGYENRMLAREDFDNDQKDAGELGAGHTVTALYELIPTDPQEALLADASLQYQQSILTPQANSDELLALKLRYKPLNNERSVLLEQRVRQSDVTESTPSDAFRFSAAVAGFGMLLRQSEYANGWNWEAIRSLAESANTEENADREEFLRLVGAASWLAK